MAATATEARGGAIDGEGLNGRVGGQAPAGPPKRSSTTSLGYFGGLDGLRALAIAAVLLYHGGVAWAIGGFLGVEAFFVLSGFLITSLLVVEWRRSSTIALTAFWGRRARRLLPALFCLVIVVGIYETLAGGASAVPGLKGDGIATLLYYGNWHQIATQSNYFAATGPVSPLQHTWSLAIEEQFYIFWPTLVLGALWLTGRRVFKAGGDDRRSLRLLFVLIVAGAVASTVEALLVFGGGRGINRVYYGTDTRAVSLLAGASLAVGLAAFRRSKTPSAALAGRSARTLGLAGAGALVGVLVLMRVASGGSHWLYPFGLLGLDLAVVVLIAAVVLAPTSSLGRIFAARPLRAIGMISYGIYLWHFPLFLWLDTDTTGMSGTALLFLRVAATLVVSVVSFYVIEQPIRRQRLPRRLVWTFAPIAAAGAFAALIVASTAASSSEASIPKAPKSNVALTGQAPGCRVLLNDTAEYGLSPMTAARAAVVQPSWLAAHRLPWHGSSYVTFHTCPPKKVLLVGDSIAFSAGLAMMIDEQRYGVELANAAILGCAFTERGEVDLSGTWHGLSPGCPTALKRWARIERSLRVQAVIVELGYRDEFDWRWNGRRVHLGQVAFDASVRRQIERYVQVLGAGGVKVLLMSVPWSRPAPRANGSPAPAASPARHAAINSMLRSEALRHPNQVQVLNVDDTLSPGNRYRNRLGGKLCRFDGVHLTIYCGQLLQPSVLGAVRRMLQN